MDYGKWILPVHVQVAIICKYILKLCNNSKKVEMMDCVLNTTNLSELYQAKISGHLQISISQ